MATRKTEEEIAAEAAAAQAAETQKAEAEAAEKAKADAEAAAAAAAEKKKLDDAVVAATTATQERVAAIFAATPAGYEAVRDEAIKSGSSVEAFKALIEASKKAAVALHAANIAEDTNANAEVKPGQAKEQATGDEAAAQAILSAYRAATGR